MADEIASVGVKFDTTDIERGNASLDVLAAKGAKVEASMAKVEASSKSAGKSIASIGSGGLKDVGDASVRAAAGVGRLAQSSRSATAAIAEQATAIRSQMTATSGLADASSGISRSLNLASVAAGAFVGAFSVAALVGIARSFLSVADAVTNVRTQLRLSEGTALAATAAYDQLLEVAQRSRVSFTDLANTYSQIRRATEGLGLSSKDTLRVTETLAKAITIGGGSAQSAQAAMIQLSQGLSAGALRGEELNSILEQTPRVARALADGLGVSIGQLRKMGEEGQLTGERVAQAFLKSSKAIDEEFGTAAVTVGQSMTVLGNSLANAIGQFDSLTGTSDAAARAILGVAKEVDALAKSLSDMQKIESQISLASAVGQRAQGMGLIGQVIQERQAKKVSDLRAQAREIADANAAAEILKQADAAEKAALKMQNAVDGFVNASSNMTKGEQKLAAQSKIMREFADAVKGFAHDSAEYLKAQRSLNIGLGNLDERFKPKGGADKSSQEAIRNARDLAAAQARAAGFTADYTDRLQQYHEWREKGNLSERAYVALVEQLIQRQPAAQQLVKDHTDAIKAQEIAQAALAKVRRESFDTQTKAIADTESLIARLQDETSAYGMSADSLARRTLQRQLDNDEAEIARLSGLYELSLTQEQIAKIDEQIDALKRLRAERQGNFDAAADNRAVEQNKAMLDAQQRDYERFSDQVGQALANSIMDGGKSALDYLKGIFRTAVLQPILRPVANAVSGVVQSFMGNPAAGIGQAGSTISGLSSLSSAASTAGAYLSTIFSPVATDIGVNAAIAGGMDAAIAAGAAEGVAAGSAAAAGAGSVLSTLATAAPYLAAAAVVIMALMKEGGGPKSGGSAVATIVGDVMTQLERERLYTPTASDALLLTTTTGLAQQVNTLAQRFGGSAANVRFGLGFDTDPLGTAGNRISAFAGSFSDTNRAAGTDSAALQQGLAEEVIRLTLAGLQASNLTDGFAEIFARLDPATAAPDAINNLFALAESLRQVGDQAKFLPGAMGQVATLSATAREALVGLAGGLDTFLQNQATFAQAFLSPTERLGIQRQQVGEEFKRITGSELSSLIDGRTIEQIKDAFKGLVLGIDLTSEHGSAAYTALLALSGPMAQFIGDLESLGEVESVAGKISKLTDEIDSLESSLADILGTAAQSPLDRLAATVGKRDSLVDARENIAGIIQDQTIQGFKARGDTAGAVEFLKGIEASLWESLGTAADPGGVANQITQVFLDRMALEQEMQTGAVDSLREQISLLEGMQRAADSIRDTILELTTGSLSALSPQDQLAASRGAFESTLTKARGGDAQAMLDLSGAGKGFLSEAQSFFGSGGDFASIWTKVVGDLSTVGASLEGVGGELATARDALDGDGTGDNTPAVIAGLTAIDTQLSGGVDFLNTSQADQVAALRAANQILIEQRDEARAEYEKTQIRTEATNAELVGLRAEVAGLRKDLAVA